MEPMVKALADDYQKQNPNAEIEVKATDSSRGITAVISGECDFAMSSRELKDYEAELLETKVIGKDAIAIVINEENPLENLTINNLQVCTMEHIKTGMIFPEKNEYNILQALTITVGASFLDFFKII